MYYFSIFSKVLMKIIYDKMKLAEICTYISIGTFDKNKTLFSPNDRD